MNTIKKTIQILLSIVLWGIILLAALFAFTTLATKDNNTVASLAGFTPLTVASDSMAPTFESGDLIIIKKCNPETLKEGDIITFHTIINNEFALNTHRIEKISDNEGDIRFTTKGDNNEISDIHLISKGDIVGKYVMKIKGLGNVIGFLSSSTGFLVVIVLPLLLFFIYQLYNLIIVSINLKKAIAREGANDSAAMANLEAEKAKAEAEAMMEQALRMKRQAEERLRAAENKEKENTDE